MNCMQGRNGPMSSDSLMRCAPVGMMPWRFVMKRRCPRARPGPD